MCYFVIKTVEVVWIITHCFHGSHFRINIKDEALFQPVCNSQHWVELIQDSILKVECWTLEVNDILAVWAKNCVIWSSGLCSTKKVVTGGWHVAPGDQHTCKQQLKTDNYIIIIINCNFKLKTGKGVKCTSPTFHFYDICSKYSCCLMMFSSCPWQSAKTGTKRKNSCLALVVPNIINIKRIFNVKEISAFCWKAYLVVTSQLELELNIFDINS